MRKSMSGNSITSYRGVDLCGLLVVEVIVLKLARVIAWLWVWVLAPLWAPVALICVYIAVVLIFAWVVKGREDKTREEWRRQRER